MTIDQKQSSITNKLLEDLSAIMMTTKNLNLSTKHVISKRIEKEVKKEVVVKKPNLFEPLQKDTLFWCFYVMLEGWDKYDMLENQHFVVEKKMKFEYIELIRSKKDLLKASKIRPLSELEDDLANKECIGIKTFFALCLLMNKNVIFVDKRKYCEMNQDETDRMYIIQKYDSRFSLDLLESPEKVTRYRANYLNLPSFDSKLKSMSSYKTDELLEMCTKLGVEIKTSDKKPTKKYLYEQIIMNF